VMAMDSNEEILKTALKMKGYPEASLKAITEVPALRAMLELQSKVDTRGRAPGGSSAAPAMALDAKDPLSIESMFPTLNLDRIRVSSGSSLR